MLPTWIRTDNVKYVWSADVIFNLYSAKEYSQRNSNSSVFQWETKLVMWFISSRSLNIKIIIIIINYNYYVLIYITLLVHHFRVLYEVLLHLSSSYSIMLLLLIVRNKVWRWGSFQWHNVHTKFCENLSNGSKDERGGGQRDSMVKERRL